MIVKPTKVRLNICIRYNNLNLEIQNKDSKNSTKDGDANEGGDGNNDHPQEGGGKGNDDNGSSSRKSDETKSSGKRRNKGNGRKRLQNTQSYSVVPYWYFL